MAVNNLSRAWKNNGLTEGDVVLIHSSIRRTLQNQSKNGQNVTPADLLESFIRAVGDEGTLLFPLFNFDFSKGVPFNIRSSPSHMGALTEAARTHPKAVRTGHPIYSFAIIGKHSKKFKEINNFSGYGDDSPFAMLRALNGKIAVLDLPDQNSMTFYHHVEETHDVPYRYHKKFSGQYTDASGRCDLRTYGLFVRDIQKRVLTHVNPAGELMWERGIYTGCRPHTGCGLRTAKASEIYDFVSEIILSGNAENTLYRIEK